MLFGDSITANNALGSNGRPARGFFWWANVFSRQRLAVTAVKGVAGETSAQILARVSSDVIVNAPGWCVVLAGTNDIAMDVALQTVEDNITSICRQLVAAGIRVILCTVPASGQFSTTARKQTHARLNRFIRGFAQSNTGVVVCDWVSHYLDPATGAPATAMTIDFGTLNTHPAAYGAGLLGAKLSEVVDMVVPPDPWNLGRSDDPDSLLAASTGYMLGTGGTKATGVTGTVPDSWSTNAANANPLSAVGSLVTRTDGVQGNWQQFVLSSTGSGEQRLQLFLRNTNVGTDWNIGDQIEASVEFEIDPGFTALTRVNCQALAQDSGSATVGQQNALDMNAADTSVFVPIRDSLPARGILRTEPLTIPTSTTKVGLFVQIWMTAGTFRVSRALLRKL